MCGIALHFNGGGKAVGIDLAPMAHRGPDSQGQWLSPDEACWFGHVRLAIVDLSPMGAQPMEDAHNGNTIIFNGEIYNHLELRAELEQHGVRWRGGSDTETLLVGYSFWKEGIVAKLKGMFAFAIYDAQQKSLFVAVDRLGIKPLYYANGPDGVRMASEVRTLLPHTNRKVSREGLSNFFQWGASPCDSLLFEEVQMFPAGHYLTLSEEGVERWRRYWPGQDSLRTESILPTVRVRELLEFAVEEHLLADVPVACFLSGGIDSSIITALAAQKTEGRLLTFAVGFKERKWDETSFAAEVARRYNTEHHRIELSNEEAQSMVCDAVRCMDLPSVDAINTYIVSKKVADAGIKVALSGLGGDELFGGYPSFRDVPKLLWLASFPKFLRSMLRFAGSTGRRLSQMPEGDVYALTSWRRRFWMDDMIAEAKLPKTDFQISWSPDLPDNYARISWVELTAYMRHILLRDSDQMSMAPSLELRVPFLDHQLVEFALGLPARTKLKYGMCKGMLVESCRDLLPPSVYNRSKMGFALPMSDWMRTSLADFCQKGLSALKDHELLPAQVIDGYWNQFLSGELGWTRVWSMVVLGHYLDRNAPSLPEVLNNRMHELHSVA